MSLSQQISQWTIFDQFAPNVQIDRMSFGQRVSEESLLVGRELAELPHTTLS